MKKISVYFFVLLGFSLFLGSACSSSEESENIIDIGSPCVGEGNICDWSQDKVLKCEGGVLVLNEDCAAAGKTCKGGACVADEQVGGDCTGSGSACAGEKIVACTEGAWVETTDCAAQDKSCVEKETGPVCEEKPVTDTAQPDDVQNDDPQSDDPVGSDEDIVSDLCTDPNGDEDEDGIPNGIDGSGDKDIDGLPNCLDADSDNDGLSDSEECPSQPCVNSDTDDTPDYLDKDSDNDGLSDKEEVAEGTEPTQKDTDGDGSDDLAEIVYGSDPTDDTDTIPDGLFFVVLPYEAGEEVTRTLEFSTLIEAIDVLLVIDASGSMDGEIARVQEEVKTNIIDKINAQYADPDFAAFGLSRITFDGISNFLRQKMTLNADEIKASLDNIMPLSEDKFSVRISEMASEPIYQSFADAAFHGHASLCPPGMGCIAEAEIVIPEADCTGQVGTIGHACFRKKSMPIVIYITDDVHEDCDPDNNPNFDPYTHCVWRVGAGLENGHTFDEAIAIMGSKGAKFIGIDTWNALNTDGSATDASEPMDDMKKMAELTGSFDKNGNPFIYHTTTPEGDGMPQQIGQAILDLTTFIDMDVTTGKMSDDQCDGISAAEFIKSSTTVKADPTTGVSGQTTTTFISVTQGTTVWFDVHFFNDFCKNTTTEPAVYDALVTVLGNGSYLSNRLVKVIVPAADAQ
ncbi:MAG TPA: hypothetical protein PLV42_00400 [bacterium]|nr:hypothetical protein [bacterium]